MSERALRACVVGVGSMGRNHVRVLSELDGVELAAVADVNENALHRTARGRSLRTYTDYAAMLDAERPDFVSVVVPTRQHPEVALAAIERGIHVLVEKPIAPTLPEAVAILTAAGQAGLKLMVGHVERFNPAVLELKRRIDEGWLGRVVQVHARRVGPFPQRIRDVGVVHDLAPHDIDVMRFIVGSEIDRLYAETAQKINTDREDLVSGLIRFRNGVVGVLDINWLTPTKVRELSVLGERGLFVVDYLSQELRFYENADGSSDWADAPLRPGVTEGPMVRLHFEKREPLRMELERFVDCILNDTEPPVTAADGIVALEVAEKLVASGETGDVVRLDGLDLRAWEGTDA